MLVPKNYLNAYWNNSKEKVIAYLSAIPKSADRKKIAQQ